MLRYALTIFVSAFLLFQVQPVIGRFVLPWFGGGPSIWTTCMLFFQLLLLVGYIYAHLLSTKLSIRTQVITHVSLLGLSLLWLPIIPADAWKPVAGQSPAWQILLLLLASVGAPYFMLSTTGPLLQRWFSHTAPGAYPYRLYALSNVGSLLALLSYPFVFEPYLRLHTQAINWTWGYVAFACLSAWCGLRLWRQFSFETQSACPSDTVAEASVNRLPESLNVIKDKPTWPQMSLWLGLSAAGSAMLLATTNQLCLDVATVPFLWVLPLSIYLFSFILCFDSPRWYDRRIFGTLLFIAAAAACWVLSEDLDAPMLDQVIVYSAVLFVCCMTCHGELVRSRPDPRYLTLFYMLISAGGALGGLFVAIVATQYFLGYWEYPIALVISCGMTLIAWCSQRVWVGQPVAAFWLWLIAVTIQVGVVGHVTYQPWARELADNERILFFGVYLLAQVLGLFVVAGWERAGRRLAWIWIGLTAFQLVWLLGYSQWSFAYLASRSTTISVVLGTVLPCLFSLTILGLMAGYNPRKQQISLRIWFVLAVSAVLASAWNLKYFEPWQLTTVAIACAGAVVLELLLSKLLPRVTQSWGIWFWVPATTLLILLGMQVLEIVREDAYDIAHLSRNFYGLLRVEYEEEDGFDESEFGRKYTLAHGQIVHGFQFTDAYWKLQPTTYYGRESGVGLAIQLSNTLAEKSDRQGIRVGVVGLGTGTLAVYGEAGDTFRFYEINPAVKALSGPIFTYLDDTPADTQVIFGDARITMERELAAGNRQQFDVLAVDAFSSDAIPVHLLTTQCGDIYRQHLRPGGILALHVSNRFLNLEPVARGLAEHLGWQAYRIENDDDASLGVYASTWILLTESPAIAEDEALKLNYTPWQEDEQSLQWTDDYSGLWRILTW